MSDVTIPGGKIRAFVERIENLDTEIQELNEQKKEVFAEAKGDGFDVKLPHEIVKLRTQDEEERDQHGRDRNGLGHEGRADNGEDGDQCGEREAGQEADVRRARTDADPGCPGRRAGA